MSTRGRSTSPRPLTPHPVNDGDVDMANGTNEGKPDAKVVIVTNLTRNVVESHLHTVFGFYGEIIKIDLPLFGKCEHHPTTLCGLQTLLNTGAFSNSGPKPW